MTEAEQYLSADSFTACSTRLGSRSAGHGEVHVDFREDLGVAVSTGGIEVGHAVRNLLAALARDVPGQWWRGVWSALEQRQCLLHCCT